jgi:hypothetical protein
MYITVVYAIGRFARAIFADQILRIPFEVRQKKKKERNLIEVLC